MGFERIAKPLHRTAAAAVEGHHRWAGRLKSGRRTTLVA